MPTQDPEELLDSVIAYLKQQQEMFGDFSMPDKSGADSLKNKKEDAGFSEGAPDPNGESGPEESPNTTDASAPRSEAPSKNHADDSTDIAEGHEGDRGTSTNADSPSADKPKDAASAPSSPNQEHSLFATNPDASGNIYDQVEGCNSLKDLYKLCQKTDVLRTDLEGTNLVFGVGNPDADLVLIGEAPGSEEDKQGEPFVGRAGQLLNDILDAIDLKRDDVYIANILKHRPPNNRNPLPEEVKRSLPFLVKQLDLIDPKLILCLGKVAANTLLDKKESLKNMRGTFYPFMNRYELLVTYHPAALLRNKRFKRPTWEDMKTLKNRYNELKEAES